MLNGVVHLLMWAVTQLAHHPKLLSPLVVLFIVGGLVPRRKLTPASIAARHGRIGNVLIGALAILGLSTYLYKNRRQASRVMIIAVCVVAAAVWLYAVDSSPQGWGPVVFIGGCCAAIAAAFKARGIVGDRELSEWFDERFVHRKVTHAAEVVLAGTSIGPLQPRADGSFRAHVQIPAGSTLDDLADEAVGSALAKEGLPMDLHSVEVVPTGKPGGATLIVSPHPRRSEWDIIAGIDNTLTIAQWAALVSDDPADPVPLGPCVDLHTHEVGTVYVPVGFPHVLMGGVTGAGKSGGFVPMIGGSSRKQHTQQLLLDPLAVEFSPWEPRALSIARGPRECYEALQKVLQLMDARQAIMTQRGKRHWRVGIDGQRLDVFIDELAAITTGRSFVDLPKNEKGDTMTAAQFTARNIDAVRRITSQARKWEIRLWAATQHPDAKVFEDTGPRDNFDFSVAYRHKSRRGARMTTGESDNAPDATKIPRDVRGGCYVEVESNLYVAARPHLLLPVQHVADPHEIITVAAEEIAAMTAHLRNEQLTYEL